MGFFDWIKRRWKGFAITAGILAALSGIKVGFDKIAEKEAQIEIIESRSAKRKQFNKKLELAGKSIITFSKIMLKVNEALEDAKKLESVSKFEYAVKIYNSALKDIKFVQNNITRVNLVKLLDMHTKLEKEAEDVTIKDYSEKIKSTILDLISDKEKIESDIPKLINEIETKIKELSTT